MIIAICGEVGAGKSYIGAWEARAALGKGRPVAASYSVHGCKYLFTLADALAEEYRGFLFIFDEAGGKLSSRKTDEADQLSMEALAQSRHNHIDLRLLMQHPRQLDICYRELVSEYHFVRRIGPSGEASQKSGKTGLFSHPWFHLVTVYKADDFDESWQLKPGRRMRAMYPVPWLRSVAETYNSWDRVVGDDQVAWLRSVQESAASRFSVPPAIVVGGKVVPQILPPGFELLMPPKRLLRKKRGEADNRIEPTAADKAFMASLGLYRHDAVDVPGSAVVVAGADQELHKAQIEQRAPSPLGILGESLPFEGRIVGAVRASDGYLVWANEVHTGAHLTVVLPASAAPEVGARLRCALAVVDGLAVIDERVPLEVA